MTTRRREIQEKARETAAPILAEMGLEIVDVEFLRRDRVDILSFFLDRPGGITVDELQSASRAIDKVLEVTEIVDGRYRLEVSSPGIDRPLRSADDFRKHIGSTVRMKLFEAPPGLGRALRGLISDVEGEEIVFQPDEHSENIRILLENIVRAKPEIDWRRLLKGPASTAAKSQDTRRSP